MINVSGVVAVCLCVDVEVVAYVECEEGGVWVLVSVYFIVFCLTYHFSSVGAHECVWG